MGAAALAIPIIQGIGAITSIYGQLKGASDRADAARNEADLKRQQADELMSRELVNEQTMNKQSAIAQLQVGAQFHGLEGGNIGEILNIQNVTRENLVNSRRDAEFKARMIRSGADIDERLASDVQTAAGWSAAGTLLGATADIGSKFYDFGSTKELGKAPTIATGSWSK